MVLLPTARNQDSIARRKYLQELDYHLAEPHMKKRAFSKNLPRELKATIRKMANIQEEEREEDDNPPSVKRKQGRCYVCPRSKDRPNQLDSIPQSLRFAGISSSGTRNWHRHTPLPPRGGFLLLLSKDLPATWPRPLSAVWKTAGTPSLAFADSCGNRGGFDAYELSGWLRKVEWRGKSSGVASRREQKPFWRDTTAHTPILASPPPITFFINQPLCLLPLPSS
ncbi:hypothetical protein PR048_018459 [Dryococelus australis]|uniref:Uncharacterized protein n=1 Tax=Dryococelus australis TaxID=614101 RepID=A0ABQ9HCC2_9NEOP|nr:hypothetical protein PR048_018459 [Dryococelus australis]